MLKSDSSISLKIAYWSANLFCRNRAIWPVFTSSRNCTLTELLRKVWSQHAHCQSRRQFPSSAVFSANCRIYFLFSGMCSKHSALSVHFTYSWVNKTTSRCQAHHCSSISLTSCSSLHVIMDILRDFSKPGNFCYSLHSLWFDFEKFCWSPVLFLGPRPKNNVMSFLSTSAAFDAESYQETTVERITKRHQHPLGNNQ